ncbi:hypothetical protein B0H10DRAFT_1961563 [Mycena sp. CBHHK59/15]|nr:hypothetical protein B0H10DRAFT_1961563 [Mycena sp. CBHHK59/15]
MAALNPSGGLKHRVSGAGHNLEKRRRNRLPEPSSDNQDTIKQRIKVSDNLVHALRVQHAWEWIEYYNVFIHYSEEQLNRKSVQVRQNRRGKQWNVRRRTGLESKWKGSGRRGCRAAHEHGLVVPTGRYPPKCILPLYKQGHNAIMHRLGSNPAQFGRELTLCIMSHPTVDAGSVFAIAEYIKLDSEILAELLRPSERDADVSMEPATGPQAGRPDDWDLEEFLN